MSKPPISRFLVSISKPFSYWLLNWQVVSWLHPNITAKLGILFGAMRNYQTLIIPEKLKVLCTRIYSRILLTGILRAIMQEILLKTFYVKWKTLLIFFLIIFFIFSIKVILKFFLNNSLTNILKVPINQIHFVIVNWVRKGEHWMNLVAGLHKSFWK